MKNKHSASLKKPVLCCILMLAATAGYSQEQTLKEQVKAADTSFVLENGERVYAQVEQVPQFPGGLTAFNEFLYRNIRYAPTARKAGVEGSVIVQFVVDKKGRTTHVKIVKGLHPDCDMEVLRVVEAMPRWKPGRQNGEPVHVLYTIPVTFRLKG